MSNIREISLGSGIMLVVDVNVQGKVSLRINSKEKCLFHWGVSRDVGGAWQCPPKTLWPGSSRRFDRSAVQTSFTRHGKEGRIVINLDRPLDFSVINFALFFPETGRWDNNNGRNYHIEIERRERPSPSLARILKEETEGKAVSFEAVYNLDKEGQLGVSVYKHGARQQVILITDVYGPLLLHWGVAAKTRREWLQPPASMQPAGTEVFDAKAVQTPFIQSKGLNRVVLDFAEQEAPTGVSFVLKHVDTDHWFKKRGQDFYIPVSVPIESETFFETPKLSFLAEDVIHAETGRHSWSLMHRFNLCHDLSDTVRGDIDGLALLFVWLRFSAIRQLDWQRNYNTKPRELSHALDRLTLKLADIYINEPESQELIRLMMTTLGRGGEGQRIRDEILNIMHKHHIKEVSGKFMEEWHQKLHNNATPDDIAICEAYLQFLQSSGDLDLFYSTLEAGGVTEERLKSFERPIVTAPDFVPHLKEALIHDFYEYLKILKTVHSGTDLESAFNAARYSLTEDANELLASMLQQREMSDVSLAGRITVARGILNGLLTTNSDVGRVRDILFLDLALEEFLRVVAERNIHLSMSGDQLVELISMVLLNLRFSYGDYEFLECSREWDRLKGIPRFTRDWSLRANAVLERLGRAVRAFADRHYQMLQPKAEHLGKAFRAEAWTVTLFSEEAVRGRPVFVVSMLLQEVVESLHSIQGKSFERPTIVIANQVRGDEQPPEQVTGVITPDVVDLVSHVAVRARNAHLLFATCYDKECLNRLSSLKGHLLNLTVNLSGDVIFEEAKGVTGVIPPPAKMPYARVPRPSFTAHAVSERDFSEGLVGGKSRNLAHLKGKLPDWIRLPASAALPFGVFEEVLASEQNMKIAGHYRELISRIEDDPRERLADIRKTLLALEPTEELVASLRGVMEEAGLRWPENWDDAWSCIKRVWASKWNERAYLSRETLGIPHEDLFMAVLIQQVVEADYAFVIHTANPLTGNRDELYAEVVSGLGETLVGNYPGRALGFVSGKKAPEPDVLSYPSKSTSLYGSGLIFRSDSSGEDLAGYAGAGLYDSVMIKPPREVPTNYADEPLVWDTEFRKNLLVAIARAGGEIERLFGYPQDIEGAYAKGQFYVVQTRPQVGI
jgi:alpha-glucan,water dikinase